jgi:hypothetical protein
MSEVITKLVIDCETGEQHIIPLTEEELAQRELDRIAAEEAQAAKDAAEAERVANRESAKSKLELLGLTESEITALLG